MPITNRDLPAGTTLSATFKKQVYTCEVIAGEDGRKLYRFGGKEYTSPSAAGSAVMGGTACNGWRFWSVAGAENTDPATAPATSEESRTKPTRAVEAHTSKRVFRQIRKVPNQKGVPEGRTKWFCSACMDGFLLESGREPATCPKGHAFMVEDDLAPPEEVIAAK